jgi:NAD(P)-dependent dehydrogenase (short-subunit alcohol dehydrogenase family)
MRMAFFIFSSSNSLYSNGYSLLSQEGLVMKTAIVTGASRGIGAATAKLLAYKGYAVAVNYNNGKENAEKIVAGITKNGGKAVAIQGNMGIEAEVCNLFERVEKELGNITALVNNAAVSLSSSVEETGYERLEEIFRVNTFGTFIACREAVKRMKNNGGGAIVNVSSEAARFGGNKMAYYAASKAAINAFTIGFAREVAPHNIKVNVVSPGVIDTDAHAAATPERLAALKTSLPMGRMGSPEEVAETIAWLLSDDASYVSGSVLSVAGAR